MNKNDLLKELKKISENENSKKEEFEFDYLKGYIVKSSRPYNNSKTRDEYLVRIVCENTKDQVIYPNLDLKFFLNEEDADLYYDKLNSIIDKKYLEDIMN